MPLDELGNKWACQGCISGHRTRTCSHYERMMVQVRRCGRPAKNGNKLSQCFMVFLRYTNDAKDQICRPADGQIPQEMKPEPGDTPPQALIGLQSRLEQAGHEHELRQINAYDASIGQHLQGLSNGTHQIQDQDSSAFAIQQVPQHLDQPLPALEASFPGTYIDPAVLHRLGHRCNDHQTGCCTDASLMTTTNLNELNGNIEDNGNGDTGADAGANIGTSHTGCSCLSPRDCRCVGCDTHPFNLADEDFVVNLINNMSTEDVAAFESHIQGADAGADAGANGLLQGAPMIMPPAQQMHAIHLHPNGQNNFDYRIVDSRTTYGGGMGGMGMDPHAMLPGAQHVNGVAESMGTPISAMDDMDNMLNNNYNSTYVWNGDAAMTAPANGHTWNNMGL